MFTMTVFRFVVFSFTFLTSFAVVACAKSRLSLFPRLSAASGLILQVTQML